jgi:hypothetical protein
MKAKAKALELFERFEYQVRDIDGEVSHTKEESVQCALICVEEIINSSPSKPYDTNNTEGYWQEVRTEINKL